jgi:hypothetical protein
MSWISRGLGTSPYSAQVGDGYCILSHDQYIKFIFGRWRRKEAVRPLVTMLWLSGVCAAELRPRRQRLEPLRGKGALGHERVDVGELLAFSASVGQRLLDLKYMLLFFTRLLPRHCTLGLSVETEGRQKDLPFGLEARQMTSVSAVDGCFGERAGCPIF